MPSYSRAPNQPCAIFPKPPGLSKSLLLPNDHYELQCRWTEAPYQDLKIGSTTYEANNNCRFCYIKYFGLCVSAVCGFVYYYHYYRSNRLGRWQLGDTTSRAILYLDHHDNQNAAYRGIISLCSLTRLLALHTTSSASTCYAFRCSHCGT